MYMLFFSFFFLFLTAHSLWWRSYEILLLYNAAFQHFSNKYAFKLKQTGTVSVQCLAVVQKALNCECFINFFL